MWSTPKTKLTYRDQLDRAQFVTKTKQDNNMIDRIGLIYAESEIELLGPIWSGAIYFEN